jgi:hypothetical protein
LEEEELKDVDMEKEEVVPEDPDVVCLWLLAVDVLHLHLVQHLLRLLVRPMLPELPRLTAITLKQIF